MQVAFIGGGNMADAIITGLVSSRVLEPTEIIVSDTSLDRLRYLTEKHHVGTTQSNTEAIANCEIVFVAVKPQVVPQLLIELKGSLDPRQSIASIAAGVTIATYSEGLSHDRIIRIMPNTPALIGQSMSVWTATASVPESIIA